CPGLATVGGMQVHQPEAVGSEFTPDDVHLPVAGKYRRVAGLRGVVAEVHRLAHAPAIDMPIVEAGPLRAAGEPDQVVAALRVDGDVAAVVRATVDAPAVLAGATYLRACVQRGNGEVARVAAEDVPPQRHRRVGSPGKRHP